MSDSFSDPTPNSDPNDESPGNERDRLSEQLSELRQQVEQLELAQTNTRKLERFQNRLIHYLDTVFEKIADELETDLPEPPVPDS